MTAIVGPSGAGKSTILGLLARLYRPGAGSSGYGGVDLREVSETDLYDAVGVVFQDAYLFGGNVRDNIAAGRPDASDNELVAAARAAGLATMTSAPLSRATTPRSGRPARHRPVASGNGSRWPGPCSSGHRSCSSTR